MVEAPTWLRGLRKSARKVLGAPCLIAQASSSPLTLTRGAAANSQVHIHQGFRFLLEKRWRFGGSRRLT